jgi:hypothetical protein
LPQRRRGAEVFYHRDAETQRFFDWEGRIKALRSLRLCGEKSRFPSFTD